MNADQKARSDSKLKNLPDDRQMAIAEYAREHSGKETVAWLKLDGLSTSTGALSEFLSWWRLRQRFKTFEANSLTMIELLREKRPELPENELQGYASEFFQLQALEQDDPKTYLAFASARFAADVEKQKLRIKEDELKLSQNRFQRETCDLFLKWFENKQARELAASSGSNADKIAQLGQLMFGEDWKQ